VVDIQASLSARFDGLQQSTDAVHSAVSRQTQWMMERYRGETFLRLPVISATGANPFSMGGDTGLELATPSQGFVWSLRHLVIENLTSGATPDIVNIRRGGATGQILWQLNGNQFAQTWGRGEIILKAGETLFYQSVGTFVSTLVIKAYGAAQQLPGERIGVLG
jgi:hypothetical protein